ncbi:MAG: DUF1848 domain-containing protein [Desulfovibrio sp.]|uniref:DUF1848 domain-containing protein n=1 Tax=Desulfovibrio sp. 7SRBS1 TaxID=3378064 RepID=UPI003B3E1AA3
MKKTTIVVDNVEREAKSPVLLSASRSTDIPAFYAEWFMNRLRAGYLRWRNPFNQKDFYYDLSQVGGIVFWSKNPTPLLPFLDEIDGMGIDYYFQFTVNDYEDVGFEPRVPELQQRLETFRRLSRSKGKDRVIWRFDPICLSDTIDVQNILDRIERIADALGGFTEQLVFSFVDVSAYAKVQRNIKKNNVPLLREPTIDEEDQLARGIAEIASRFQMKAFTCGEPRSFEHLGIAHNKCVDGNQFARICRATNHRLQKYLGIQKDQMSLLPQSYDVQLCKAAGQRKACGCIESKDVGMYNTCRHMCIYCYANHSEKVVEKNKLLHDVGGDGIL